MESQNNCHNSMLLYRSFFDTLKLFPDSEQLDLVWAAAHYALNGIEPNFGDKYYIAAIWVQIKRDIDANNTKYWNACKGGKYGNLGGAPTGNKNASKNNPKTTADSGELSQASGQMGEPDTAAAAPNTEPEEAGRPEASTDKERQERAEIFRLFFFRNVGAPTQTTNDFWNYYAANGWKRENGAYIVNKEAAARGWKVQDEARRFAPPFLEFWTDVTRAVPAIDARFSEVAKVYDRCEAVELTVTEELRQELDGNARTIAPIWRKHYGQKRIIYRLCEAPPELYEQRPKKTHRPMAEKYNGRRGYQDVTATCSEDYIGQSL